MSRSTQAFEDMLEAFFSDFLDLVDPGLLERLGAEEVLFLDRQDLAGWPEEERRGLGLLAAVRTRRGDWRTVLVQVETEEEDRQRIEEKLLGWYLRLALDGLQPARMIVVYLRGGQPGVNLEWISDEVDGKELLRVPYLAFGLAETPAEVFLAKPQPLAWALSALMQPTCRSRQAHVQDCLRRIAGKPLGRPARARLGVDTSLESCVSILCPKPAAPKARSSVACSSQKPSLLRREARLQEKPAVFAVVAPIVRGFRRLGRRLAVWIFALGFASHFAVAGASSAPPDPQPPLQATEAHVPAPAPVLTPSLLIPIQAPKATTPTETPQPAPALPAPAKPAVAEALKPAPAEPTPEEKLALLQEAADLILEVNTGLGVPQSPYGQLIYDIAVRHSINPQLVAALIHVESSFNPRAVSRRGAYGLMQLLPATARRFGVQRRKDLFDPVKNLEAGIRYLKWLTERFGGNAQMTLAAYNAGEGAVARFGGIPPYRETQQYVKKIIGLLGLTPNPPAPPPARQDQLPEDLAQ